MTEQYRIKSGYRINAGARTFDKATSESYWTRDRLRLSASYQRPVYELAQDIVRRLRRPAVLDMGSGPGVKVQELIAPHVARLVLIDQPNVARLVKERCPTAEFIAMNLDAPERERVQRAAFDVAICADVIEHLHDPDPCLAVLGSALKPNGRLIISTPERDALRGENAMACDKAEHVREWNFAEFADYLSSRGWHILDHRREYPAHVSTVRRWRDRLLFRSQVLTCQVAVCAKPAEASRA